MYVCRLVVPSRVRSQSHSIFLIHDSSIRHPLRSTTPIAHQSKLIINSIHHRSIRRRRASPALTARRTPRRRLPTSTQFDDAFDAFDAFDDDAFDDDDDDDDDDENNQQEFIIIDRRSSETDARTRRDARTSREHRDERVFDPR